MQYYVERLDNELRNILSFWYKNAYKEQEIAPEVDHSGSINRQAPLGTIYLSRIIYGASAACTYLKDKSYLPLADCAYNTLITKLKNPKGGYYWGIQNNTNILHDETNISMAQAFVVYGLGEYYALTGNESVRKHLDEQINFIENTLKNNDEGSFRDGFTLNWDPLLKQTKSLGTHLHLLEAYVKFQETTKNINYLQNIERLIEIILGQFINPKMSEVIHQFDNKWKALPNENWIGHNVEVSWILYKSAMVTENPLLLQKSKEAALSLCTSAIELGFDVKYGGMFNRFNKKHLISNDKEWWPQAESVIAFLNAYSISVDKKFLSHAIRLLEYIDNTFSDPVAGEWYDSVSREGMPYRDKPKLHFWKSMYHNVRYCIETSKSLQKLFVKT
jgi:mannobiose 2-epimerase